MIKYYVKATIQIFKIIIITLLVMTALLTTGIFISFNFLPYENVSANTAIGMLVAFILAVVFIVLPLGIKEGAQELKKKDLNSV